MRILYIFPHPDDESFGPAAAIANQVRSGHEVHLLTLTRGGATKRRFDLGYSVEQMGEIRYREMREVERTLGLAGMQVLDLPDSGLKDLDPRVIETVVREEILRLKPAVVVSYAAFGVSGFLDHLVTHAVVKRAFVELRDEQSTWLRRLAFFTIARDNPAIGQSQFGLRGSDPEDIDCVVQLVDEDRAAMQRALDCYTTYQETIRSSNVLQVAGSEICFEIFGENHKPPLSDITAALEELNQTA